MCSLKPFREAQAPRASGIVMIAALMLGIVAASAARALPVNQRDFDINTVRTAKSTAGVLVPGTFVTVNNDVARICIIEFSAEATSTIDDGVLTGYTIDSTNPANCDSSGGPFLLQSGSAGTHTAVWTKVIARGLHTIRACYGLLDADNDGGVATLFRRSLTVECRTQ